jgi:hypothetical protein
VKWFLGARCRALSPRRAVSPLRREQPRAPSLKTSVWEPSCVAAKVPRGGACGLRRSPGRSPGRAGRRTEVALGTCAVRHECAAACFKSSPPRSSGEAVCMGLQEKNACHSRKLSGVATDAPTTRRSPAPTGVGARSASRRPHDARATVAGSPSLSGRNGQRSRRRRLTALSR